MIGGLVLLREAKRRLRLAETLAGCIRDRCRRALIVHTLAAMPRFRRIHSALSMTGRFNSPIMSSHLLSAAQPTASGAAALRCCDQARWQTWRQNPLSNFEPQE